MELSFILLIIGALLLCAEIFMPGFGVCGICGIALIVISAIIAFLSGPAGALIVLSEMVLLTVFICIAVNFIKKRQLGNIILDDTLAPDADEFGDLSDLVGMRGVTLTALRPIGSIEVDGKILEAYSESGYVSKNQYVKIAQIDKHKVYVRALDNQ